MNSAIVNPTSVAVAAPGNCRQRTSPGVAPSATASSHRCSGRQRRAGEPGGEPGAGGDADWLADQQPKEHADGDRCEQGGVEPDSAQVEARVGQRESGMIT